jgi:hypothetical protein
VRGDAASDARSIGRCVDSIVDRAQSYSDCRRAQLCQIGLINIEPQNDPALASVFGWTTATRHAAIETKRPNYVRLPAGADANGSNGEYDHRSPLMVAPNQHEMRNEVLRCARVGVVEDDAN